MRPRSDCASSSFRFSQWETGNFLRVQQFCNLSNWNLVTEPRNVGFNHKLFTVSLLYSTMSSIITYTPTRLSKVKVKWSRYRAGLVQKVGRGIALLFHDRDTRRGLVVSSTPRPHITPWENPVPILQEAGWAPGPVWKGGKSRPYRDSIPDRPARCQSLYRLSYRAHAGLSSGSNWILQSVLPATSNALFKPAALKFKVKAMYSRMMKYGENDLDMKLAWV